MAKRREPPCGPSESAARCLVYCCLAAAPRLQPNELVGVWGPVYSQYIPDIFPNAPCRYQKGIGRLREEKRAAKVLRAQLAEERGFVADTVLAKLGMPRLVRNPA